MTERCILTRTMQVGEAMSFDNGRIVVQLVERTGRDAARIRFDLDEAVLVHKPGGGTNPERPMAKR